jgi:RHS repeat-associated protein
MTWNAALVNSYGPLPGSQAPVLDGVNVNVALATRWNGLRIDPTGFYYIGARYYDPMSGKFTSPDPLGHAASMSLYDYCNGDPVNGLDPDGRCSTINLNDDGARQLGMNTGAARNYPTSLDIKGDYDPIVGIWENSKISPLLSIERASNLTGNANASVQTLADWSFRNEYNRFEQFMPFIYSWENVCDKNGNVVAENVSGDSGGLTKYGIDQRTHPKVDIANLTQDQATLIYWDSYWQKYHCGDYSYPTGELLFNARQNGGPRTSAIVNLLPYDIIQAQMQYYQNIADRKPGRQKFLNGWTNRTNDLANYLNINIGGK